jgi:hypothetical protein
MIAALDGMNVGPVIFDALFSVMPPWLHVSVDSILTTIMTYAQLQICEDMKLRDSWSRREGSSSSGALDPAHAAYYSLGLVRRALGLVAAAGGGPAALRYTTRHDFCSGQGGAEEHLYTEAFSQFLRVHAGSSGGAVFGDSDPQFEFSSLFASIDSSALHSSAATCSCSALWLQRCLIALNDSCGRPSEEKNPSSPPHLPRFWRPAASRSSGAEDGSRPAAVMDRALRGGSWTPSLDVMWCFLVHLQEAVLLSSSSRPAASWRLLYALMRTCGAAAAESPLSSSSSSSSSSFPVPEHLDRVFAFMPRPIALAVQLALIDCASKVPADIMFEGGKPPALSAQGESEPPECPLPPAELLSRCLASLDTVMLLDRMDVALNSLSSIGLMLKYDLRLRDDDREAPWEASLSKSSRWSRLETRRRGGQKLRQLEAADSPLQSRTGSSGDASVGAAAGRGDGGSAEAGGDADGLEALLQSTYTRFPDDERIREVCLSAHHE